MSLKELESLVFITANGIDRIDKGAVGFNGYGFAFRDIKLAKESFITWNGSSKFCTISLILKRNIFQQPNLKAMKKKELYNYISREEKQELLIAGSLKTLIPSLQFGGDELLYFSWMFVKTPDGRKFPATLYYGQSGTSLGGWKSYVDDSGKKFFPEDFLSLINFSPFNFTDKELEDLVISLESALHKVPVSDFYGVYRHDAGESLMIVKYGIARIVELERSYTKEELERLISLLIFH